MAAAETSNSGSGVLSRRAALACLLAPPAVLAAPGEVVARPQSAPGPLDNPLKGWCTYTDAGPIYQPYSMVFRYVSWRELEPVEGVYAFAEWERRAWGGPGAQGKHVVLRVYADYPSRPSGVPEWLLQKGVKTTPYSDYGGGRSPDYDAPALVAAMARLIAAMGRRYDGDPRVAFVQLGLLGFWGEWHTFPRTELFASLNTQGRIVDAFRRAFPNKHLMARYASGTLGRREWMGFHDDMFPEDTDGPEGWEFLPKMRQSGRLNNWKTAPVGGEMVPNAAKTWMGERFDRTLAMTERAHFSWVGPYSPALEPPTPEFLARCARLVRRMGYEFRLTEARHPAQIRRGEPFPLTLRGVNQGVAPFYYPWPLEVALLDGGREVAVTARLSADARRWLPGPFAARETVRFDAPPGNYALAVNIRDPWAGRPGVGFANRLPRHAGWTLLSRLTVR